MRCPEPPSTTCPTDHPPFSLEWLWGTRTTMLEPSLQLTDSSNPEQRTRCPCRTASAPPPCNTQSYPDAAGHRCLLVSALTDAARRCAQATLLRKPSNVDGLNGPSRLGCRQHHARLRVDVHDCSGGAVADASGGLRVGVVGGKGAVSPDPTSSRGAVWNVQSCRWGVRSDCQPGG